MQYPEQLFQQVSAQMTQDFAVEYNAALQKAPETSTGDATDKRSNQRRRSLKAGVVSLNNGNITLPCVVRDISDTGAKLKFDVGQQPPDTFQLQIELEGLVADCLVIWREGQHVGVEFSEPAFVGAPTRKQVVYASDTPIRKSLLRRPLS